MSGASRATKGWFTAAAVLMFASIVMGAVVASTQSSAACPNWPGCYDGRFLPSGETQLATNPVIEFVHRAIAGATGPVVLIAALLGLRLADRLPKILAWVGLAGTLAAGVFGMLTVKYGIPWGVDVLDLGSALVGTVAMIHARVLLTRPVRAPRAAAGPAWAALGVLWVMHLLGIAVAGHLSFTRCLSWPIGILHADRWPIVQGFRLVLAAAALILIAVTVVRTLRGRELHAGAWAVVILMVAELALGAGFLGDRGSVGLRTVYAVVAAFLFGAVALLASRSSLLAQPVATPTRDADPVAV